MQKVKKEKKEESWCYFFLQSDRVSSVRRNVFRKTSRKRIITIKLQSHFTIHLWPAPSHHLNGARFIVDRFQKIIVITTCFYRWLTALELWGPPPMDGKLGTTLWQFLITIKFLSLWVYHHCGKIKRVHQKRNIPFPFSFFFPSFYELLLWNFLYSVFV